MQGQVRGRSRARLLLLLSLLSAILLALPSVAAVPDDVCAGCHEMAEEFHATAHGTYLAGSASWSNHTCETCHGSAVEHIEDGDPAKIINPAKSDQFGSSVLCLTCHNDHTFDQWSFSSHQIADVGCASCHVVHESGTTSIKKGDPELCYDCHSEIRHETYMPSAHPIAEGKMQCGDCHNVHGGETTFQQTSSSRELCFSCHAEVEGPFVYEHAPVNEDCMICHSPHGTVADKLLKQSEPALCLNCHAMHFHATVVGSDGPFQPPADSTIIVNSTTDGWSKGFLTKCTQCHDAVHGSDHPSQTISTGGNALTR